jgi:hypothetical protein
MHNNFSDRDSPDPLGNGARRKPKFLAIKTRTEESSKDECELLAIDSNERKQLHRIPAEFAITKAGIFPI